MWLNWFGCWGGGLVDRVVLPRVWTARAASFCFVGIVHFWNLPVRWRYAGVRILARSPPWRDGNTDRGQIMVRARCAVHMAAGLVKDCFPT